MQAILSIDQGTTSSRALLFSLQGEVLHVAQKELDLIMPYKGWVEQDPEQIWGDVVACCKSCIEYAAQHSIEILGIGITNQRETSVVWDRENGKAIYNAIVWQDRRTAQRCRDVVMAGHDGMIAQKTGLVVDAYFSATKIEWILKNVDGAQDLADQGKLAFGTMDSFLLWRLTNGSVHLTDVTNASRTMLYDIQKDCWDDELLGLFHISQSMLPDVKPNDFQFGVCDEIHFGLALPICGIAGDQQSALIGQGCFDPGMVKSTYGTGCFALMNIGETFEVSENKLLTTIAYNIQGQKCFALEGSIFVAGAAIQWLRDGLKIFEKAPDTEEIIKEVDGNGGVYFVPALTGLGAPYWNPDATGLIAGLTRDTTQAHIVRAALEAQAYQTLDLFTAMRADSGAEIKELRCDGGLVANNFVCQFLADIVDVNVDVPAVPEATAWGAAFLAGLNLGVFKDKSVLADIRKVEKQFKPNMSSSERENLYQGWKDAVQKVL